MQGNFQVACLGFTGSKGDYFSNGHYTRSGAGNVPQSGWEQLLVVYFAGDKICLGCLLAVGRGLVEKSWSQFTCLIRIASPLVYSLNFERCLLLHHYPDWLPVIHDVLPRASLDLWVLVSGVRASMTSNLESKSPLHKPRINASYEAPWDLSLHNPRIRRI